METAKLKKFAQFARRSLIEQVASKLAQVLKEESSERRELPNVVAKLEGELKQKGKEQLIEQVAYVWFNRFCALRFMDVNSYNRIGVLSPAEGQFQPEILAEAKAGHIDDGVVNDVAREKIFGLLNGSIKSRDGQSEAYRLLIVAVCNDYHRIMPYLFERIEDYTELLMPDDLLSGNSILAYTREAMTPEACGVGSKQLSVISDQKKQAAGGVEVIGWLYQFYISEKKDLVFEGLKKNKKITPENIPAATQLFTPHWIVRYLVENSLGRLWMLNNPSSKVIEQMDYYIKPSATSDQSSVNTTDNCLLETDYLVISSPEEIKVCDPACGSGHMLTYAYDLLYAIYLDAGYDPVDIPELILNKNLYGIEIDERAAELAAFALSMKALKGNPTDESNNRRRFFRNPIKPNICRLKSINIDADVVQKWRKVLGESLVSAEIAELISQFDEADNFGSLIKPVVDDVTPVLQDFRRLVERSHLGIGHPDRLNPEQELIVKTPNFRSAVDALKQADYLSQKYHVVVANPPYMGSKGMNGRLAKWAKDNYPDSKTDLFAMFIERNLELALRLGYSAMINMQSWMFLSSFERLRKKLMLKSSISSMAHLGPRAFDSIGGEVVATTAYILENIPRNDFKGAYIRLVDGKSESEKESAFLKAARDTKCAYFYRVSSKNFNRIPGSPAAYFAPEAVFEAFDKFDSVSTFVNPRIALATGNNGKFLRSWFEISRKDMATYVKSNDEAAESGKRWFPCNRGGDFRKWSGNKIDVVDWYNDGFEMRNYADVDTGRIRSHNYNGSFAFQPAITWSALSASKLGVRLSSNGFMFVTPGSSAFKKSSEVDLRIIQSLLSSNAAFYMLRFISSTLNIEVGDISRIPVPKGLDKVTSICEIACKLSGKDWDTYETSWDFSTSPLLQSDQRHISLDDSYRALRVRWQDMTDKMQRVEEENNQIFIDAFRLQNELTPEVPIEEVTLTCNPAYRYGTNISFEQREERLKTDTVGEFLSYAVGCMFGRYSLNLEGLVLANQGDTLEDYLKYVPQPSFVPDEDNVIPMIDFEGDWFEDDISERFKEFLKVTFGEEHFAENLAFVEEAIGKDIKKYFVKDFYADHVKRYKKRPIYWLFSSPKGSFNALIYMHRYRSDTVSVVLNDYLREFRTKLQARKESYEQVEVSASASQKEKTQAIKAIDKINKVLDEVNDYERDILYPLAGQNKEIDLDDGVKHNYPLFGKALKKIAGLS